MASKRTSISGGAVSSPVIGSSVTVEFHRTRSTLLAEESPKDDFVDSALRPLRPDLLAMVANTMVRVENELEQK